MLKLLLAILITFTSSILLAQTSIDTLALFPDTTTFQGRGSGWVDDVVNWGVRFHLDSTIEYSLVKIIVMGHQNISPLNPTKTNFRISTGNMPEDSIIYQSDVELTSGFPEWQTINLDQPLKIKDKNRFYITGSLFFPIAVSINYHTTILDQYVARDRGAQIVWYEGIPFYYAIKSVVMHQTSGINDLDIKQISTYQLSQNYPNPFNSETVIQYNLQRDDQVRIELIDALGRVVKELYSGDQNSGEHKLSFNAEGLSGGIYFIRMKTPTFSDIKKMVYLK